MNAPPSYLVLYMFNILISAIPSNCLGSLIPFMAADLDIDETDYALLFVFITLGCLSSAILFKVLTFYQLLPKYHTTSIVCALEIIIFSVAMPFVKTKASQIIILTILNIFGYLLEIVSLICLAIAPAKDQVSLWTAFAQGAFGLGSLAASMLTGFLSYHIFTFLAILCVITIPMCYFLPSPESFQEEEKQSLVEQSRECSTKLQVLISLGLILIGSIQYIIRNWLPTFGIQKGIADAQQGALMVAIFSACYTIFRFGFGALKETDSSKLSACNWGQLLSAFICTLLAVFGFSSYSAYLTSLLFGVSTAIVFPIMFSIPHEFGLHFTDGQILNIMIFGTLSEGVSALAGKLMKTDLNAFQYSLLGCSILLFVVVIVTLRAFKEEQINGDGSSKASAPLQTDEP